jgi:Xaa-Pro aminopeptidase
LLANVERIGEILEKYSIDVIIASTPENVTYLSDFRSFMQQYARTPIHVVWPRERSLEPSIILSLGESRELLINRSSWIRDVKPYGEFIVVPGQEEDLAMSEREFRMHLDTFKPIDAAEAVVSSLRDRGLDEGTVALDEMWVSTSFKAAIQKALPRCRIQDGYEILREIRMVKTSEEVRRLKKAAEIAEQGAVAVMNMARPGVSGAQLAEEYNRFVIANSALPVAPSIAIGRFSYLQNIQRPPMGQLERGDLIRLDPGCIYEYYFSDIARTAVIGEPSHKQRQYCSALLAGEKAALDLVRSGAKVSDIFHEAIRVVRSSGIPDYRRHHIGHGIGIEFYDDPKIGPNSNQVLRERMVVNIELPYYELGFGGLHIEDTVLVKSDGHELLSTSDRDLHVCS